MLEMVGTLTGRVSFINVPHDRSTHLRGTRSAKPVVVSEGAHRSWAMPVDRTWNAEKPPASASAGVPPDHQVSTMLVGFDADRVEGLQRLLRRHGHDVRTVPAGAEQASATAADLVIVETDEGASRLQLCREIRAVHEHALIAVSSRNTEAVRLQALDAGCDDHLDRNCGPLETMARIDAVLRWVRRSATTCCVVAHGPLRLDRRHREVHLNGCAVHLTRKEFDLLWLIAARAGEVVARPEILEQLWGEGFATAGRSLDTHVSSLRRKVGKWVCVTVKGYGLRIGTPPD